MALDPLPDPIYLLELRSTRTAALELLALAVAGGTLGAFVVLRRLAFYTHAVGTATFPGVVVADAAGFPALVAALAVALAYAGGVERAGRSGRDPGADATGLMLVLALAGGTILASDVFGSGAGVDRVLFGSAVALSDTDVVVAAIAAVLAVAAAVLFGRAWAAVAFDPGGAPGLGVPGRRADLALLAIVGVAAVAALPAVGALLVTSLFVVPGRDRAPGHPLGVRAGGGVCWRGRRAGPGGAVRVGLAGRAAGAGDRRARRRLLRGAGRRARTGARAHPARGAGVSVALEVRGLAAGYGGAPVLTGVSFTAAAGSSVCVLGPNGGGKTTLFRALAGQLAPAAGSFDLAGRPAHVAQATHARLDFPVSALDVAVMGSLAGRWWLPARRRDRDAARTALERVGLPGAEDTAFGALSGGQRQRVLIARALVQDAAVLLLDEPLAGVDPASAETIRTLFASLTAEGRTLLVSSHDVEGARAFDTVLCLNRSQVAYGDPATVLDARVLETTYGRELIVIPDGEGGGTRAVAIQHHEH